MLPLHPLAARNPPLSVFLQGRGEPYILPSAVRAYVPLLSALLLRQGVPLHHPSANPGPLPLLSALIPQRVEPTLQPSEINSPPLPQLSALPLAVCTPIPQLSSLPLQQGVMRAHPLISVLLQGLGVPPLLTSAMHAYAPLLW